MTGRTHRDLVVTAVKYGLGALALAWMLSQADLRTVPERLSHVEPRTLFALLVVTVIGLLARIYTWYVVIRPMTPVSFRASGHVDLVVNFVNQLLPSRLSGRMAAPFVLRSRVGTSYADAAAISGVHTGIYAVLYGVTSLAGVAVGYDRLPTGLLVLVGLSTALYLAAGAVVLVGGTNLRVLDPLVDSLAELVRRVPRIGSSLAAVGERGPAFTASSTASFRELATNPGIWLRYAAGWLVALVVAPGVRAWLLLASLGITFEPTFALPLYLVLAYSVTLLPLTPGGIGITEATATAVFVALGVPHGTIVLVVLVDRTLGTYLPALAGWYPSLKLDLSSLSPE